MTNATKKAIRLSILADRLEAKAEKASNTWYNNEDDTKSASLEELLYTANCAATEARAAARIAVASLQYQFEINEYRDVYNASL